MMSCGSSRPIEKRMRSLSDTGLFQLFVAELAVGVAGRMQQAGTGIRHMSGDDRQLQGIHEFFGLLPAALQGEGEHAAGALWAVFLRKRMIVVVFQLRHSGPMRLRPGSSESGQRPAHYHSAASCGQRAIPAPAGGRNAFCGDWMAPRSRMSWLVALVM